MSDEILQYDEMVENALRSVVRQALQEAGQHGLPGDHHFYLAFNTNYPGIELPAHLKKQYPEEMTIVLQHQFYGLKVVDDIIQVTLSFSGKHERLVIPLAAVVSFADPTADFALRFQTIEMEQSDDDDTPASANDKTAEKSNKNLSNQEPAIKGEVISLDKFRKKP